MACRVKGGGEGRETKGGDKGKDEKRQTALEADAEVALACPALASDAINHLVDLVLDRWRQRRKWHLYNDPSTTLDSQVKLWELDSGCSLLRSLGWPLALDPQRPTLAASFVQGVETVGPHLEGRALFIDLPLESHTQHSGSWSK